MSDKDTITLFHGSTYSFNEINLAMGNPYKDFGRGFYATAERKHAVSMARRNLEILNSKMSKTKTVSEKLKSFVYEYTISMTELSNLNVCEFTSANREWVEFVTDNRTHNPHRHKFDVVIGPTANDRTNPTIQTYLQDGYGTVGSERAIAILLELLEPYVLPFQYFFGTEKAIGLLQFVKRTEIK